MGDRPRQRHHRIEPLRGRGFGSGDLGISSKEYHRQKNLYFLGSILTQAAFLSYARFAGFLDHLPGPIYFFGFYCAMELAFLPIRILSGHCLERKFGLSKQSFLSWSGDYLKGVFLGAALFVASALLFYACLGRWPNDWWWILAVGIFIFGAILSTVFPIWVLPLFYRSEALADEDLEARCQETLKKCGLPKIPILKLHLGQKTVRANAALVGFGPTRRILLGDTLLAGYTPDEIQMVAAHEAGHHVKKHIFRTLVLEFLFSAVGFYVLYRVAPAEYLSNTAFFPVLMMVMMCAGLLMMPACNLLSRAHEREADRFALRIYPDGPVFHSLMEKLSRNNLANPEPSQWEEFILYSHPSRANRVRAAQNFLKFLAKSKTEA